MTKSDEWYTPPYVIKWATEILEYIDLDPASCKYANDNLVHANRYYSKTDDGLAKSWEAETIWMNPPYSRSQEFVNKLMVEFERKSFQTALVLLPPAVETRWFQTLASRFYVAFPSKRIRFVEHTNTKHSPRQGNAIFLVTRNWYHKPSFCSVMSKHGVVMNNIGQYVKID